LLWCPAAAGAERAEKVRRETVYETWYAPSAKQLARERSRFFKGDGWRERELIGTRLCTDH